MVAADPPAGAISESPEVAQLYEQGRPSYPDEVLRVAEELGLRRQSAVLDLAAGTGKLTRVLRREFDDVVAVEPSAAMLAELHRARPEVDVRVGAAEAIPLADGTVDAVFVAEAFHWFDAGRALREIARVLTPRGGLVLMWNRHRWGAGGVPWADAFNDVIAPYRSGAGAALNEQPDWHDVLAESGLFTRPNEFEVDHVHHATRDDLLALVGSWSWIARLGDDERRPLMDRIAGLVDGYGDEFVLPYCTRVLWSRLEADK
jgi:SAM-dependent methyltransferase